MFKNRSSHQKRFPGKRSYFLKRALLSALLMSGFYSGNVIAYAENSSAVSKTTEGNDIAYSYVLQDVLVWGNRWDSISVGQTSEDLPGGYISQGARLGFLGETSILKTPFTQFSFTEKSNSGLR